MFYNIFVGANEAPAWHGHRTGKRARKKVFIELWTPTSRLKNNPEMRTNRWTVGTDRETMRKSLLYNCFIMNEWRHSVVATHSLARYDINYVHDTVVFYECSFIYTRYKRRTAKKKKFFFSFFSLCSALCVSNFPEHKHTPNIQICSNGFGWIVPGWRSWHVFRCLWKHRQSIYYVCATVKWFKTIAKWLRTIFSFCWIHSI